MPTVGIYISNGNPNREFSDCRLDSILFACLVTRLCTCSMDDGVEHISVPALLFSYYYEGKRFGFSHPLEISLVYVRFFVNNYRHRASVMEGGIAVDTFQCLNHHYCRGNRIELPLFSWLHYIVGQLGWLWWGVFQLLDTNSCSYASL
jgi:hypothetical protein